MKVLEGSFSASGYKIAVVAARFNDFVVNQLLTGTIESLEKNGCSDDDIEVFKVPGAFEIPSAADKIIQTKRFDAVICLGAVIRGETPHFEYVSNAVSNGVSELSLKYGIPVIFGVLTTDTIEQAVTRAGIKAENKGNEFALAAIEMADLFKKIK
jgi:6,7-dimethyl-8-ribityllumazine synthase